MALVVWLSIDANVDTVNSGKVVAKLTMVAPKINSDIPVFLPINTVSTLASIDNHTTMSLGNAVGSIICNTGLILGLVAFISPFKVDKSMFSSRSIILLVSVLALMILGRDGSITREDGLILIVILIVYMYTNVKSVSGNNKNIASNNNEINSSRVAHNKNENLKTVLLFALGLVMMVVGSKLLVDNGVKLASFIGIPQGVISLTVIASVTRCIFAGLPFWP